MPKGFSNFKSFTSGVLGSLNEDTEIRKKSAYADDMMKREMALKSSYLQEQEAMQEKRATFQMNAAMAAYRQGTNQSTNTALTQAAQPPTSQVVQGGQATSLPDPTQVATDTTQQPQATPTAAPNQAPQAQPAVMQTVQNAPQQGTPSTQPQQAAPSAQGGLNSPQGGPVPIDNASVSIPTPHGPLTVTDPQAAEKEKFIQEYSLAKSGEALKNTNSNPAAAYMIGQGMRAEAEEKWQDLQNKKTETELKKAELEQKKPVDLMQQGSSSADYATVMMKKGIIGSSVQEPLTAAEKSESYKIVSSANALKQSAENGIQSFVRSIGGAGKAYSGPLAGVLATAEGAWDQMTDTQRSESLQNYFKLRKETIQQLNAQIGLMRQQTGGGIRFGVKSMEMEEKGIPDPTKMGPEEVRQLGLEYINTYKSLIGSSNALIDGGKHIHPLDRIQMANTYSDENPVTLEDGVTPNPDWKEWSDYKKAVATDTWQAGATQESNRATQTNNITNNDGQQNKVIPYTEYFK